MFGLFGKKENPHRTGLREDFERVTSALHRADGPTQMAVGHSINLANSMFVQRFGSPDAFRKLPQSEKSKYLEQLTAAEEKLQKEQPHASIGFALFKMWVGTLAANDDELMHQFSKGLSSFSAKGDLGG